MTICRYKLRVNQPQEAFINNIKQGDKFLIGVFMNDMINGNGNTNTIGSYPLTKFML